MSRKVSQSDTENQCQSEDNISEDNEGMRDALN